MDSVARSLRTVWIFFKHEFNLYFMSPIVYLIGAVWLALAGLFYSLSLFVINQGMQGPTMSGMHQPMVFLMLFVAPALTMRLVSDELRAGTHELLFTAPVRDWEIIIAKWLAVWAVFTVMVLVTLPMPLVLILRGNPDTGLIISGYLGLWLFGAAALAVGVLASSLTQYQAVAFMITMGVMVVLWIVGGITRLFTNPTVNEVLSELSLTAHYQNLVDRALIDPVDIAYFIGLIILSLFLATQSLSTRRWSA